MRKILVCTDFSAAAAVGEREAGRWFPDATLIVFHAVDQGLLRRVIQQTGADGLTLKEEMTNHADRRLSEVVDRLISQGHRAVAEMASGEPVVLALAAAKRHGVEAIVIGVAMGDPVGRFRTQIGRQTGVPVLMIPSEE